MSTGPVERSPSTKTAVEKGYVTLLLLCSLWQPDQKIALGACGGVEQGHELDRLAVHHPPMVRGGLHPWSVGRDCPRGAQIDRVSFPIG
jgi:hypothetical protein